MECKSEGVVERGRESESEMCYRLGSEIKHVVDFQFRQNLAPNLPAALEPGSLPRSSPVHFSHEASQRPHGALAYPIPPPLAPPHWHFQGMPITLVDQLFMCLFGTPLPITMLPIAPSTHHGTNSPLFFSPPRGNLLFQRKKLQAWRKGCRVEGSLRRRFLLPSEIPVSLTPSLPLSRTPTTTSKL